MAHNSSFLVSVCCTCVNAHHRHLHLVRIQCKLYQCALYLALLYTIFRHCDEAQCNAICHVMQCDVTCNDAPCYNANCDVMLQPVVVSGACVNLRPPTASRICFASLLRSRVLRVCVGVPHQIQTTTGQTCHTKFKP